MAIVTMILIINTRMKNIATTIMDTVMVILISCKTSRNLTDRKNGLHQAFSELGL